MSVPAWLPAMLVVPAGGNLEAAAWTNFQTDFAPASPPVPFRTGTVELETQPHPGNAARPYTYWHLVTEGSPETARTAPIAERLERIPWLRPLLVNHAGGEVRCWWKKQFGRNYFCLWCVAVNYLVVLKDDGARHLLTTAYPLYAVNVTKKIKEWSDAQKAGRTF